MGSKGKILLVTNDQTLVKELKTVLTRPGFELAVLPNAREAAMKVGTEPDVVGVVADSAQIPVGEREQFLRVHKENGFPLVFIESLQSLSPLEAGTIRRVFFPMPQGFTEQILAAERPAIFLVDQTLFVSNAVRLELQRVGLEPVSMESPKGMAEFLQSQLAQPQEAKPKSFWQKLKGAEEQDTPAPSLGHVMVALFTGSLAEAGVLDSGIRQYVPQASCYYVTSEDPLRASLKDIAEGRPAHVVRDKDAPARVLALFDKDAVPVAQVQEKGRVLILENFKPNLEAMAAALMGKGYEVTAVQDASKVSEAVKPGNVHVAVLGAAMTQAKLSAAELASSLKKTDPDIHFVLMVDPGPLVATMRAVGKAAESGIDAVILKDIPQDLSTPSVDTAAVINAVHQALEHRRTILENVRLRQEAEEKNKLLAQQKEQLERVNGFQTRFFQMVAHDVKNPLAAIMGHAELLGMKLKDLPKELEKAAHIHSAAKTLNFLISDLVDLAAIETGKLRVNMEAIDLASVVNDVKSRVGVPAQQRKIELVVELPSAPLPAMQGDPNRLGQVIQNLCTNAIQYTKEGGKVTVKVDVEPERVVVGVRDTGIGISKVDLPRVFERFFQTAEAQKMRKAGFGLGLKIAREIVQRHGGDINVESELGVGSRFFFWLPRPKPAA